MTTALNPVAVQSFRRSPGSLVYSLSLAFASRATVKDQRGHAPSASIRA